MKFLLVPVIMVLACGGSVGLIKGIQKLFPNSDKIAGRANEWIDQLK